ncbi:MAG: hypothetical protein IIC67_06405 [Thaumarchaeota archaeon]|nr:hypothetical protein [Nitrososphaerota archaeon]
MAVAIIGGTGSGFFLKINSDGSINVSGVSVTSSITAGSESFIFGRSGGTWMPLAVQSGTEAVLRTTSSVTLTQQTVTAEPGSTGAILSGVNTIFLTHIIGTGSIYNMTGVDITGTADGTFTILENATPISMFKNSTSERNVIRNYSFPVAFIGGGSIVVQVVHGEILSQSFDGAIYGYESS